jgi:hypothetical protein
VDIDDTILEKIRKVQGYLQSDNPNEAAVAAAKLSEMLIKYNLDLSDIPEASRPVDPFANVATDNEGKRLADWRIDLASAIARANLCKIVISGSRLQWLGRQSNIEVAQFIYETTARDLQNICDALWYAIRDLLKDDPTANLMHGKTWKHDFMTGAAFGVKDKLQQERQRWEQENANVTALIVTNDRELAIYTRSQYPSLSSSGRGGMSRGGNAFGLGRETGRNVQFKTGVGAGGSNAQRRIGG